MKTLFGLAPAVAVCTSGRVEVQEIAGKAAVLPRTTALEGFWHTLVPTNDFTDRSRASVVVGAMV